MGLGYPQQGEGYAAAYAISATPFVTSSSINLGEIKEIKFGYASKFIIVKNTSDSSTSIAVAFAENGLKPEFSNYFTLNGTEAFGADLRVSKLYISGSAGSTVNFSVVAGLTFIPEKNMITLTGSIGFPGVG